MGIDRPTPNSAGELEVISTEKELHYIMNRPVSAQPCYLLLTVALGWRLVYGQYMYKRNFASSILVADSKGETSDFTYIKNQTVSNI